MIVTNISEDKKSVLEFSANILILHHPTTIKTNYQPVIHCGPITQAAKICDIDKDLLRSGDRAKARFKFMNRPEYIKTGNQLIFREGKTKGIGTIVEIH